MEYFSFIHHANKRERLVYQSLIARPCVEISSSPTFHCVFKASAPLVSPWFAVLINALNYVLYNNYSILMTQIMTQMMTRRMTRLMTQRMTRMMTISKTFWSPQLNLDFALWRMPIKTTIILITVVIMMTNYFTENHCCKRNTRWSSMAITNILIWIINQETLLYEQFFKPLY